MVKPCSAPPTFGSLYDLAFSWNPEREVDSIFALVGAAGKAEINHVLDLGAGTGRFTIALAQRGIECTALEPDADMAETLRRNVVCHENKLTLPIVIVQEELGAASLPFRYDLIILMTDTLSYFWPIEAVRSCLVNIKNLITLDGLIIVDIGLFNDDERKTRSESWTFGQNDSLRALYRSKLISDQRSRRRWERLRFVGQLNGMDVDVGRSSTVSAFSSRDILDLFTTHGFRFVSAVRPGGKEPVDPLGSHKRLVFGFRSAY